MKRILCATDFSAASENALRYANALAETISAQLDLIHVYHLQPAQTSHFVMPGSTENLLQEEEQKIRKHLMATAAACDMEVSDGQLIPVYGLFTSFEIVEFAKEKAYDLIVMGVRGEHSLEDKLMGTVTTHTMLQAPCPVIAVPQNASFQKIEHIAYATGFAPEDDVVIAGLVRMANLLKARLHYVHVSKQKKQKRGDAGENRLILSQELEPPFVDFTWVENESILQGLDQYIKDQKIDLLALFIPERRLWEQLFHRSVSRRMVFNTEIPLVVFHQ